MVTKDNLVFGLAGMVLGLILGVLLVMHSAPARQVVTQTAPVANPPADNSQMGSTAATQGELPEGHPPVNQESLKQQIAEQEAILNKDPKNQDATVALGNLYFDQKEYPKAAQYYETALQRDPKNVNLITDLGSAYLWMNNSEKAMELYKKSLSIDPNHMQTLMNIGIAKMSMGDRAGAADAWEKVVTLYPDNPEAPMLRQAIAKLRSKQPS